MLPRQGVNELIFLRFLVPSLHSKIRLAPALIGEGGSSLLSLLILELIAPRSTLSETPPNCSILVIGYLGFP